MAFLLRKALELLDVPHDVLEDTAGAKLSISHHKSVVTRCNVKLADILTREAHEHLGTRRDILLCIGKHIMCFT